jgi:hypothetical protein
MAALIFITTFQILSLLSFNNTTVLISSASLLLYGDNGCNCRSPTAAAFMPECCQRVALRAHKMGTILIEELFADVDGVRKPVSIKPELFPSDPTRDYRHVAMVRNVFEAMVSGYLYHLSGKECWLDIHGIPYSDPSAAKSTRFGPWEASVVESGFNFSYPAPNGRTICQYLVDETRENGMAVYIAAALHKKYLGLQQYYDQARERELRDGYARTKFICFEAAEDPAQQETVFRTMTDWLFPGGHSYEYPVRKALPSNQTYQGSHSTSREPQLRQSLRDLVRKLDHEIFHGYLATLQSDIKCGNDAFTDR